MRLAARLAQSLFRWRSDGTAPFRLGQRRIFMLPTRGGLLYAAALLVMLIGAINYNLALGHALVFLLAGLGLTGMVHTFRNLHGLEIAPGRVEPVFAGETAQFELLLSSDRPAPRCGLRLAALGGDTVETAVDGGAGRKIAVPLPGRRRGWLELPRVRLSTVYPLGLFTAWSYLQPAMRCLVYPAPHPIPLPAPAPAATGGTAGGAGGDEDFAGFRARQPGDSPHHVAWKAAARETGDRPLLVKQFAGGSDGELRLDWASTAEFGDTESRISVLAGWVVAADEAGLRHALNLPGQSVAAGLGPAHRRRCLETLALWSP